MKTNRHDSFTTISNNLIIKNEEREKKEHETRSERALSLTAGRVTQADSYKASLRLHVVAVSIGRHLLGNRDGNLTRSPPRARATFSPNVTLTFVVNMDREEV